jgi:hypothetical protein
MIWYFSDVGTPGDAGIVGYGPPATGHCPATITTQSSILVLLESNS